MITTLGIFAMLVHLDRSHPLCQNSAVVRDLDVLLDIEHSMQQYISKVASTCYYHLRRLRQIRSYVSHKITTQLVVIVFHNIQYRLLQFSASWTSSVNTFSPPTGSEFSRYNRLVTSLSWQFHITPALQQLH